MKLVNNERVLLLHPSHNSDQLSNAAIVLTEELTSIVKCVGFEDASLKDIKRVINICRKGIERVMKLEGSCTILSADLVRAEQVLNESLEVLATAMNDAALEIKKRAMTDPTDPDILFSYAELLNSLIDTALSWSQGKVAEEPEEEITLIFDED